MHRVTIDAAPDPRAGAGFAIETLDHRPAVPRHPLLVGALIGLGWGVLMRLWMRLIAADPEFSWAGTLFIVLGAVVVGVVLGLARLRRSRGGQGWWRLSILSLAILGLGGAVMWPTVLAWGAAFARRRPRMLVGTLLIVGAALQVGVVRDAILADWTRSATVAAIAVAAYIPLLGIEAWGFSVTFAPDLPGVAPARWKRIVTALPIAAFCALSIPVLGMGG